MHHNRTTAQQVLRLLKVHIDAKIAAKQLMRELGADTSKACDMAFNLIIKLMG